MKTIYIYAAIVACSVVGTLVGGRNTKTALLVACGALAGYGIYRIVG